MRRDAGQIGRGFTLTELLVAIAAIAILTVAIASVFSSVGRTIEAGRTRSRFTTTAERIERQLREDLGRITRDGVLVIRHELIGDDNLDPFDPVGSLTSGAAAGVALDPDDLAPRARRADELMFFARGDFVSARAPVVPGFTARSGEARIYWGHGVQLPDTYRLPGQPKYQQPEVYDQLVWVEGRRYPEVDGYGLGAVGGPNEYAADWTLLRQVTLLRPPSESNKPSLPLTINGTTYDNSSGMARMWDPTRTGAGFLLDRKYQIGGQPAAASVFQSLSVLPVDQKNFEAWQGKYFVRPPTPSGDSTPPSTFIGAPRPLVSSGLVDVASESLATLRLVVQSALTPPYVVLDGGIKNYEAFFDPISVVPGTFVPGPNRVALTQAWMRDAFPTNDTGRYASGNPDPSDDEMASRARIRYEPEALSYFHVLSAGTGGAEDEGEFTFDAKLGSDLERAARLADQQMLASSVVAPGCTELIVEWSFGDMAQGDKTLVEDSGELVWHGLARAADEDGDGNIDDGNEWIVRPYPFRRSDQASPKDRLDMSVRVPIPGAAQPWPVAPGLIHGWDVAGGGDVAVTNWTKDPEERYVEYQDLDGRPHVEMYSYFGWVDPFYDPTVFGAGAPKSVEWPWPRLIRVTMRLADPVDPLIEETFQFVFEVGDGE